MLNRAMRCPICRRAGRGWRGMLPSTVIGHPFDPTDARRLTNSKELQVGR